MTFDEINALTQQRAVRCFLTCCGSKRWAKTMADRRPFESVERLYTTANEVWFSSSEKDWKEAFSAHPKIGDMKSLRKKFQNTSELASKEQSRVLDASEKTLRLLTKGNRLYESKFGYIFIVCATGKSAEEMLEMLNKRLNHYQDMEITIAAEEQAKITRLRLEKLLD